ncbi:hypothetical protein [Paenibacillus polymyxa]|uniref:hypothetical protein n=1 Tax=Paenibacillus polymyxa TaxID=1406 RepID=UPI00058A2EFC|nr:hypothetical protein [Paenibacillus polymyxa]AJE54281.1 hypothetical protein RE92_25175 [Paenibacillus polymyxa]
MINENKQCTVIIKEYDGYLPFRNDLDVMQSKGYSHMVISTGNSKGKYVVLYKLAVSSLNEQRYTFIKVSDECFAGSVTADNFDQAVQSFGEAYDLTLGYEVVHMPDNCASSAAKVRYLDMQGKSTYYNVLLIDQGKIKTVRTSKIRSTEIEWQWMQEAIDRRSWTYGAGELDEEWRLQSLLDSDKEGWKEAKHQYDLFNSELDENRRLKKQLELKDHALAIVLERKHTPWVRTTDITPDREGTYHITDGKHVDVAFYQYDGAEHSFKWYPPDMSPVIREQITHWAPIALPDIGD